VTADRPGEATDARTAWHAHPKVPTLNVTTSRRGGDVREIRPGDLTNSKPEEEHWHYLTPDRCMSQVAIQEAEDHVTDEADPSRPAGDEA
jgi:quercetin dioxygenase-like cupin family protein